MIKNFLSPALYCLLLFLTAFLFGCNEQKKESSINGIKKGGEIELAFSKDLLQLDIYFNNSQFEDPKVGELFDEAMKHVKTKDFAKAKTFFLKAHQLEPENPVILNSLGSIATEFRDYEAAVEYHLQAINFSDSTYAGALNNLGLAYLESKNYEKALDAYRKALQVTDNQAIQASAWYSITHIYLGMEDCEKAKVGFTKFHERTKNIPNYAVLNEYLHQGVEACGEIILKNRKNFRMDDRDYTVAVEEVTALNSLGSMEQLSVIKLQQRETEKLKSSRNISKADFQFDLYTEFFENAELTSTEIVWALNKRLYLITRLSRKDSSRTARIMYILTVQKDRIGDLEVKKVTYSLPEQEARNMATAK